MLSVVAILVFCVLVVVLAVATLWGTDRIRQAMMFKRNSPEKIAAARQEFEKRLLQPDWAFYERHLQRPVPGALIELYSDRDLLLSSFQYDDFHHISTFEPICEQTLIDCRKWFLMEVVPFANSEDDLIYLRPGEGESNAVFVTYHDGGDTEQLAPDVSAFLERARLAKQSL